MDTQDEFRRKAFAIDCEMVDVLDLQAAGSRKAKKFPIKVVIVDEDLEVIYDVFIKPNSKVLSDNSFIHGISLDEVIAHGISYDVARRDVHEILQGNFVVGHDLEHDLKALGLHKHVPDMLIRDTACARMFVNAQPPPSTGWQKPSLAQLAKHHLQINIQRGFHEPLEDARTAMRIYIKYRHSKYHQGWLRPSKNR